MESEMRPPGLVDDNRNAGIVRERRDCGDIAQTPTKFGSTRNMARASGAARRASRTRASGSARASPVSGSTSGRIQTGRARRGRGRRAATCGGSSRHDHLLAGSADGERERLVSLGRAVDAEAAEIGSPEVGSESLGRPSRSTVRWRSSAPEDSGRSQTRKLVREFLRSLVTRRCEWRDRGIVEVCRCGSGKRRFGLRGLHSEARRICSSSGTPASRGGRRAGVAACGRPLRAPGCRPRHTQLREPHGCADVAHQRLELCRRDPRPRGASRPRGAGPEMRPP